MTCNKCPTDDDWALLLEGALDHRKASELEASLDQCPTCMQHFRDTVSETEETWTHWQNLIDDGLSGSGNGPPDGSAGFLQRFRSSFSNGSPDAWQALLDPPETPNEVGRLGGYSIEREIGHGGMGVVLLGRDTGLDREVAIKIMRPSLAGSTANRERFLREARAAAAIEHRHVVPIHQVGQHRDVPFLVMKRLQGESLASKLRSGPLDRLAWNRLAVQVTAGLDAIHQAGQVHRDLKPENIWLESPDNNVRILDFGLTRPQDDSQLTQTGSVMGTPAYMSPEQARGEAVDARSDLYSLGSVLYTAATGTTPVSGNTPFAILTSLATDTPPSLQRQETAIDDASASLVMQLLEKDAAKRPASAAVVLDALQTIHASSDHDADPDSGIARRTFHPPAIRIVATGLAVIAILLATSFTLRTSRGQFVVELSDEIDPSSVVIEAKSRGKIRLLDSQGGWQVEIAEGEYAVRLAKGSDQFQIDRDTIRVTRNGKQTLRVTRKPATGTTTQSTKEQERLATLEWIIDVGGTITLGQSPVSITRIHQLPDEPFIIHTVDLTDASVHDEDIDRLLVLGPIHRLILGSTRQSCLLSDKAFPSIAKLNEVGLRELQFNFVYFRGSSLKHLSGMTQLIGLAIYGTEIRDQDLGALTPLKNLRRLTLRDCRLTGAGLQMIADAPIELLALHDATLEKRSIIDWPSWPSLSRLTLNAQSGASLDDEALLSLDRYPELTELNLIQLSGITSDGLNVLRRLRKLESLQLSRVPAVNNDTLHTISTLPSLKRLTLKNTTSAATKAEFRDLESAKQLELIDFGSDGTPSQTVIDRLSAALPDCNIVCNPKGKPSLDPNAIATLEPAEIPTNRTPLEKQTEFIRWVLSVGGSLGPINAESLDAGTARIPDEVTGFHTLDLRGRPIRDGDIDRLADLTRIQRVILGRKAREACELTDDAVRRLARLERLRIRELQLYDLHLTGDSLKLLGEMDGLVGIRIESGEFTDEDLEALQTLTRLERLNIVNDKLTGHGLRHVREAPLLHLTLEGDSLQSDAIASLPEWPNLDYLTIATSAELSDEAILSLRKYDRMKDLHFFDVQGLSPKAWDVFTHFHRLKSITMRRVSGVTDSLLAALADQVPTLKQVDFSFQDFSDEGIEHLHRAQQLEKFKLQFQPNVSREAIERLREALPACEVES